MDLFSPWPSRQSAREGPNFTRKDQEHGPFGGRIWSWRGPHVCVCRPLEPNWTTMPFPASHPALERALAAQGYLEPTPVQAAVLEADAEGRDLLVSAQTGSGKTVAFGLAAAPTLLGDEEVFGKAGAPMCLVIAPTRELAIQIDESIAAYGRHLDLKHLVIFGGVSQHPQTTALRQGTDILVATPGRLLDLMQQGFINLAFIQIFVLDEADRMLDMGFIYDVKAIVAKLPEHRQTLFFSATMPNEIAKLADTILHEPVRVEVTPVSSTAKTIVQSMYFVEKTDKTNLLIHLLSDKTIERVLVFTRTKHGADKVVNELKYAGIQAEAIHGNKSQNARQKALANFKSGETPVLVATDIAARGIDVEKLTHVINYGLPSEPETYIHRIGRTGRAGSNGIALSPAL